MVCAQLSRAPMRVLMTKAQLVHFLVLDLGCFRRAGRAGDVGDCRYVIPIDAMAQTENEGSQEQRDGSGVAGHARQYCMPLQ
jgi:hypothetical protein